jgi:hypothetical protein
VAGKYTKDNLHDRATRERFDPELQKQRTVRPPACAKKK